MSPRRAHELTPPESNSHTTNPVFAHRSGYDVDRRSDRGRCPGPRQSRLETRFRGDVVVLSLQTQPIVSIVTRPSARSAWIRLVGDIDMMAEPALATATDRLNGLPLRLIVIDLSAVTFVCSTLVNFLTTLHRDHPHAELVLHRPSPMARTIITVTGMDTIVSTSGHPATSAAIVPGTTATASVNTRYPGSGGSAIRSRPGHWEAMNRQQGRTTDFGDTGNSGVAMIRAGARSTNRRLVDGAQFVIRHRHTLLRWVTRTRPSNPAIPPGRRHS